MTHRTETDEETGADANYAGLPEARRAGQTTKSECRAKSAAASLAPAAGSEPPSLPATFHPLGTAVRAVVLRLQNKRIRLKVMARAALEEEDGAGL